MGRGSEQQGGWYMAVVRSGLQTGDALDDLYLHRYMLA